MPRKEVDWEAIKAEYVRGGVSQQALANKYGIHRSAITRHIKNGNWKQLREDTAQKADEKLSEIVSDTQAATVARLTDLQTQLAEEVYKRLLESVKRHPPGAGTRITRETVTTKTVKLTDGQEKTYPLKSANVTDLEAITRAMVNIGRLFGIDAQTEFDKMKFNTRERPETLEAPPENNLFSILLETMATVDETAIPELKELSTCLVDNIDGDDLTADVPGKPAAPDVSVTPSTAPSVQPAAPAGNVFTVTGERRDGRFIYFQFDRPPKGINPVKLMIDGDSYPRVTPPGGKGLPDIGIEAPGSFIGKPVTLL